MTRDYTYLHDAGEHDTHSGDLEHFVDVKLIVGALLLGAMRPVVRVKVARTQQRNIAQQQVNVGALHAEDEQRTKRAG